MTMMQNNDEDVDKERLPNSSSDDDANAAGSNSIVPRALQEDKSHPHDKARDPESKNENGVISEHVANADLDMTTHGEHEDAFTQVAMEIVEEAVAAAVAEGACLATKTAVAASTNIPTTLEQDPGTSSSIAPTTTRTLDNTPVAALETFQKAAFLVLEADKKRKASELLTADSEVTSAGSASPNPTKKRASPARVTWEERVHQLTVYKQQCGDLLIPIRFKLNRSLGKFVHNTREQYKLYHKQTPEGYKKKCSLTAERIAQLDALGFVWSTDRTKHQNDDWQSRLLQLKVYKDSHGHCLVPHGYREDPSFAEWVHRQRTTFASMIKEEDGNETDDENNNRGTLNNNVCSTNLKERMDQLRDMGFNFTVHSDKWIDHWQLLKEYKEKNGVSSCANLIQMTVTCGAHKESKFLTLMFCTSPLLHCIGLSSSHSLCS
jgi:hypothetical protein